MHTNDSNDKRLDAIHYRGVYCTFGRFDSSRLVNPTATENIYPEQGNTHNYGFRHRPQTLRYPIRFNIDNWIMAWNRFRQDTSLSLRLSNFVQLMVLLIEPSSDQRRSLGIRLKSLQLLCQSIVNVFKINDPKTIELMTNSIYLQSLSYSSFHSNEQVIIQGASRDEKVRNYGNSFVERILGTEFSGSEFNVQSSRQYSEILSNKVLQELNKFHLEGGRSNTPSSVIFDASLVDLMFRVIDENERLTNLYPIHVEAFDVERKGPLPLRIGGSPERGDSLNEIILREFQNGSSSQSQINNLIHSGLHLESCFEIRIDFRLKESGGNIFFCMKKRGFGGHLSLGINIINSILLDDIPSLSNFFPLAIERFIHHQIIGHQSSNIVYSHSLVQLCRKETLAKALTSRQYDYDDFSEFDPTGKGNYVDISLLLSNLRSKLNATLDAIHWAIDGLEFPDGVNIGPSVYLSELKTKINRSEKFEEARSLVFDYPNSLFAADQFLQRADEGNILIQDHYDRLNSAEYLSLPKVFFEAELFIIHSLLDQCLYESAREKIQILANCLGPLTRQIEVLNNGNNSTHQSLTIFSGSILASYEIAWSRLYFLDAANKGLEHIPVDDGILNLRISRFREYSEESFKVLEKAQNHLDLRQRKYQSLGETSQGAFSPYYDLQSDICYWKAMNFFLMSGDRRVDHFNEPLRRTQTRCPFADGEGETSLVSCYSALYWMEMARLNSALGSNQLNYVRATSYQMILYVLISVYTSNSFLESKELEWATKLRNDMIYSFKEIGNRSYHSIKEKSGVNRSIPYIRGGISFEPIGNLYEYRSSEMEQVDLEGMLNSISNLQMSSTRVVPIDLSYLYVKFDDIGYGEGGVYLLSPFSCYIFLARGFYHLASTDIYEFASDNQSVVTESDLNTKVDIAYKLFTYAWTFADDFTPIQGSIENGHSISRGNSNTENFNTNYIFQQIKDSVGYLSLLRISEVRILGKLLAACCLYLKCSYSSNSDERGEYNDELTYLLNNSQLYGGSAQPYEGENYEKWFSVVADAIKEYLEQRVQEIEDSFSPSFEVMNQSRIDILSDIFRFLFDGMAVEE